MHTDHTQCMPITQFIQITLSSHPYLPLYHPLYSFTFPESLFFMFMLFVIVLFCDPLGLTRGICGTVQINGSQPVDHNCFGSRMPLSRGSPKSICTSDIYIAIHGSSKIAVVEQQREQFCRWGGHHKRVIASRRLRTTAQLEGHSLLHQPGTVTVFCHQSASREVILDTQE